MSTDDLFDEDPRRPLKLVWLHNPAGDLTTMCRGAVLTIDRRGESQWTWAARVGGHTVSEGVSPTRDHAMTAAAEAAVEAAKPTT